MTHTTIAVLVGSLRSDSVNRKLAGILAEQAPAGVTVEIIDGLGQVPFYNEDLDNASDIPATAARLRERVGAATRILAVTPEYNGTMPAVLNNAIDWLSRPYGAGAVVVEDVTVSQSSVEVDVLTDPDVLDRLNAAVRTLVEYDVETAAA